MPALTNEQTAERIVAYCRAKGNQPLDLRDAAHEAHHALYVRLRGSWDRERLHLALEEKAQELSIVARPVATMMHMELNARAVEWDVCERLGIPYDLDQWIFVCYQETLKNMRVQFAPDAIKDGILDRRGQLITKRYADQVLALASRRMPKLAAP